MKFKMLLSAAVAAAAFAAAVPATATPIFPVFTVTPGAAFQGSAGASFQANDLGGQYQEVVTFGGGNTFNASLIFFGNNFNLDDTVTPHNYLPAETGLGSKYSLYATFLGSGTFTTVGTATTFTLNPGGSLNLWFDSFNATTTFTQPANGSTLWGTANAGDDILLASGTAIQGSGTSFATNCPNNNCGSFGQTTSFTLTNPAGTSFFTNPVPFFNVALSSGQFQGINPVVGTSVLSTGTANTNFNIPEPSPLALVGLGLLALGFSRRRSTKA